MKYLPHITIGVFWVLFSVLLFVLLVMGGNYYVDTVNKYMAENVPTTQSTNEEQKTINSSELQGSNYQVQGR